MKEFDTKSKERLGNADKDLVLLAEAVLQRIDVVVTCSHRNKQDQDLAYKTGNSKLKFPQSKHNTLPSKAIDFAIKKDGNITWDKKEYDKLGSIIKEITEDLNLSVKWGGDFSGFYDGPHVELVD